MIASIPSAVYPLSAVGKSQGVMRIAVRHRTTILSSTVTPTTLPSIDTLIEKYFKKEGKDRFDDGSQRKNDTNVIISTSFFCLFHALFTLLLKLRYH